jgi:hypothetical protein
LPVDRRQGRLAELVEEVVADEERVDNDVGMKARPLDLPEVELETGPGARDAEPENLNRA